MNKKVRIGKLNLEKTTITRLSNLIAIQAGSKGVPPKDTDYSDIDKCTLTVIGSRQTVNQGPTKP